MRTGIGPYRHVQDEELRSIFFIDQQEGSFNFIIKVKTAKLKESDPVEITKILRAMLYCHQSSMAEITNMRHVIARATPTVDDIPLRGRLFSVLTQLQQKPWAFPACISTNECRKYYKEMDIYFNGSAFSSEILADPGTSTGAGFGVAYLAKKFSLAAASLGLSAVQFLNFFGGKSKDYYDFYMRRIENELALRGIPKSKI